MVWVSPRPAVLRHPLPDRMQDAQATNPSRSNCRSSLDNVLFRPPRCFFRLHTNAVHCASYNRHDFIIVGWRKLIRGIVCERREIIEVFSCFRSTMMDLWGGGGGGGGYVGYSAMGIAVGGRRIRRGRPSTRWLGNVRADLSWE